MILLLSLSHLDIRDNKDSAGEEDSRVEMDSSHLLEHLSVLALDLLETVSDWGEAVSHVFLICVSSAQEVDSNDVRVRCVNGLEDLLENDVLEGERALSVFLGVRCLHDEVSEPE